MVVFNLQVRVLRCPTRRAKSPAMYIVQLLTPPASPRAAFNPTGRTRLLGVRPRRDPVAPAYEFCTLPIPPRVQSDVRPFMQSQSPRSRTVRYALTSLPSSAGAARRNRVRLRVHNDKQNADRCLSPRRNQGGGPTR